MRPGLRGPRRARRHTDRGRLIWPRFFLNPQILVHELVEPLGYRPLTPSYTITLIVKRSQGPRTPLGIQALEASTFRRNYQIPRGARGPRKRFTIGVTPWSRRQGLYLSGSTNSCTEIFGFNKKRGHIDSVVLAGFLWQLSCCCTDCATYPNHRCGQLVGVLTPSHFGHLQHCPC